MSPAQILVTHEQLEEMYKRGHDVVICESVAQPGPNTLDAHVLDEESMSTETHLSVIIDPQGKVIGEQRLGDYE